jgi:hypothetical protein
MDGLMMRTETIKWKVSILWGTDQEVEKTYSFQSQAELNAFMKGVDEMDGWLKYEIKE